MKRVLDISHYHREVTNPLINLPEVHDLNAYVLTLRQFKTRILETNFKSTVELFAPLSRTAHVQILAQGLYQIWTRVKSFDGEANPLVFCPAVRMELSLQHYRENLCFILAARRIGFV